MVLRVAQAADLPAIVGIYNASIPGRMATADLVPVSVDSRRAWFSEFDPARRPLWVEDVEGKIVGWLSLRSFYGRPAYQATAELAVYCRSDRLREGTGSRLLAHAISAAPALGLHTLLAFVFGHNRPSLGLLEGQGFAAWGRLPQVAELDGVERDLVILGKRVA